MKNNKFKIILSMVLCLLPIIFGLSVWDDLPSQMPVHFGVNGEADGFASRPFAVIGIPVLMAFFNALMHLGTKLEKRKENYSKKLHSLIYFIIPVICILIYPLTIYKALGKDVKIEVIIPAFVSVVITIVGNYLPKCKQNSTMGIKLPWTFKSEENWNKTHHMAGYLWMGSGIIGLIVSLLDASVLCLPIFAVIVIVPTAYSYYLHKKGI